MPYQIIETRCEFYDITGDSINEKACLNYRPVSKKYQGCKYSAFRKCKHPNPKRLFGYNINKEIIESAVKKDVRKYKRELSTKAK